MTPQRLAGLLQAGRLLRAAALVGLVLFATAAQRDRDAPETRGDGDGGEPGEERPGVDATEKTWARWHEKRTAALERGQGPKKQPNFVLILTGAATGGALGPLVLGR